MFQSTFISKENLAWTKFYIEILHRTCMSHWILSCWHPFQVSESRGASKVSRAFTGRKNVNVWQPTQRILYTRGSIKDDNGNISNAQHIVFTLLALSPTFVSSSDVQILRMFAQWKKSYLRSPITWNGKMQRGFTFRVNLLTWRKRALSWCG